MSFIYHSVVFPWFALELFMFLKELKKTWLSFGVML